MEREKTNTMRTVLPALTAAAMLVLGGAAGWVHARFENADPVAAGMIVAIIAPPLLLAGGLLALAIRQSGGVMAIGRALRGRGWSWNPAPAADERERAFAPISHLQDLRTGAGSVTFTAAGPVDGVDLELIEHRCLLRSHRTSRLIVHTVLTAPCPDSWPRTSLSGESVMGLCGPIVGFQDLQLQCPQFNRRWRVKAEDEAFARRLLTADVQTFLADAPGDERWEIGRGTISCIRRTVVEPRHLRTLLLRPVQLSLLLDKDMGRTATAA
ncbi:MAG: hypothetical protein ACYTG1_04850 [Planctomycetota bacterium]|jgi:hypothetical protein